jgi:glutathione reductase (NADPH)
MPPTTKPSTERYDYIIVGGGSGGSGSSVRFRTQPIALFAVVVEILTSTDCVAQQRRAALYGKKVAVIESTGVLGGCCVKVGT